jgi:hypothetical protein
MRYTSFLFDPHYPFLSPSADLLLPENPHLHFCPIIIIVTISTIIIIITTIIILGLDFTNEQEHVIFGLLNLAYLAIFSFCLGGY